MGAAADEAATGPRRRDVSATLAPCRLLTVALHDTEQADPSLEAEGPLRGLPQAEGAPQRQLGR